MRHLIRRPSPAMVVACLALFVALGSTGYAALVLPKDSVGAKQIRTGAVASPEIRHNTIRSVDVHNGRLFGRDIKANTLGDREINESKLAKVPSAGAADTLGGLTAGQLKTGCPIGMTDPAGTCIEVSPRPAESLGQADTACALAGRQLPTYLQLKAFFKFHYPIAAGGELTATVAESRTTAGQLDAIVILNTTGSSYEFINANGATKRRFRCATTPTN